MKHTKGPWATDKLPHGIAISHGKNGRITFLHNHIDDYMGYRCGSICSQNKTQEEVEANANLIAAAPELLEACEAVLEEIKNFKKETIAACALVIAIEKARR